MNIKPFIITVLIIFTIIIIPFNSITVPAWQLKVTDHNGRPLKGFLVRQTWQNYSLELEGNEQDLRTNESGEVAFPQRTMRANLIRRSVVPVLNAILLREHASYGVTASVTVWGEKGTYRTVQYKPNQPLPGHLILPTS